MNKSRIVDCLKATMKITFTHILLGIAFTCSTLAGTVEAQILDKPISLSVENTDVRSILRQIQRQAEVKFVYSPSAIGVDRRISVHVSNKKLSQILDQILVPLQIRYRLKNNRILLYPAEDPNRQEPPVLRGELSGQAESVSEKKAPLRITGRVTGKNKEGIPGASVLIKGTTQGTTTDADGRFGLTVPDENTNGTLVFSFIGYKSYEVPLRGQTVIDVELEEDVARLSEVIVNGYQTIRKESFTGTAITITGSELKAVNPLNLLQSVQAYDPSFKVMENNVFGSNPNRLPDITVRGATGLPSTSATQATDTKNQLSSNNLNRNNPNLPTFILNGFEVSLQTIYDLDMNRVETVTLLKDAAATAIYGSRAANGVLVITTKKPEEGKLQFRYNYELTVNGPDLTVYDVLNAEEKLEYERLAGVYTPNPLINGDATVDQLEQSYYRKKKNVLGGVDTYWLSEPVETALGHNHSLSVEGGSQALLYSVTGRYQNLAGVMKGSDRNRYGVDVNLSYRHKDKFEFSNNLSFTEVQSQESPYGSFETYVKMNPYYPKTDSNGNYVQEIEKWQRRESKAGKDGNSALVTEYVLNPIYNARLSSFDKNAYTQIINSFAARWKIVDGLDLRGQLSITKQRTAADRFKSPFSNQYYDKTGDDLKKRGEYLYRSMDEITFDGNLALSYNKVLHQQHIINAVLGTNLRDYSNDYKGFTANGFASDRFDQVGFANQYINENDNYAPEGSLAQERLLSAFANLNYSFSDRYLMDLAIRMDGSSKFGSDNKYAPFWAAGIGWNLHKEAFLASSPTVNQLKIRASTGLVGEVSFEPYLARTTYQYYKEWYSSGVGARHMGYGNPALKWQRTQNYDLGMEMQLFQHRLFFAPRYYYRLTKDVLADIIVPPSVGFPSYKANLGLMSNRGFEVNLRATVIRNKNLQVSLHGNFTRNVNRIEAISESLKRYNDEVDKEQEKEGNESKPLLRFREGESLNTIYAVRSLGIDPETGREIYVKKDGTLTYQYSVKDVVPVGDTSPEAEGFFGTSISFKNFTLLANFYTRFGGDLYNQTLIDRVENAHPRDNVDRRVLEDRWKRPGDEVFFKNITDRTVTRATSRFVQRDNVVELKSLNLSYEAPQAFSSKLRMDNIRLMVTMNDVWRWSAAKMERGIDFPFSRSVTFSVLTRF